MPKGSNPKSREALRRMHEISMAVLAERRARTIEDLTWILGTCSGEEAARRVGYTSPRSLERMLHKWGEHDLATRFRATCLEDLTSRT